MAGEFRCQNEFFLKKAKHYAPRVKGVGILQMIKNGWMRNLRLSDFIFFEFRLFKFFRLSSLLKNDPISWITYVLHNRDKNRHPAIKWEIEADYQLKGRVDFRQNLFCSSNAGCISFFQTMKELRNWRTVSFVRETVFSHVGASL